MATAMPEDWPGGGHRTPSRRVPDYLARKHLVRALTRAVAQHLEARHHLLVIDVGAGEKPYYPLFRPYARYYLGVDYRPRPNSDIAAVAEALPIRDQCTDVVLATQMLEHVEDPGATIREWRRVLRPGGLIFASTHGVFLYHPDPADYWRWTHAGLRKLFEDAGLRILSLEACGGNASALGMLVALHLTRAAHRVRLASVMGILLVPFHKLVELVDGRRTGMPSLAINYLVVAQRD